MQMLAKEKVLIFIYFLGCELQNVVGFVDGTVQKICCPIRNQKAVHSGHKRHHTLIFQRAVAPNKLFIGLVGPWEGHHIDSRIFCEFGLKVQHIINVRKDY